MAATTSGIRNRLAVLAAVVAAVGVVAAAVIEIPRLAAPAPAHVGAGFNKTVQFAGFTIELGRIDTRVLGSGTARTWSVTVQAQFTNSARFGTDSAAPAARLTSLPTLTIDGDTRVGTLAMPILAHGARAPGRFTFADYNFNPNLQHAVLTFGNQYTQRAVVPMTGEGFTSLMPVPVKISGIADTGADATFAAFQSAELRADVGFDPTGRGALALILRFGLSVGKNYTNGAQAGWDASNLVMHSPSGKEIRTEFGATSIPCPRCIAIYYVPPEPGDYTIVNTYVGYGTRNGQVSFQMPSFGPVFEPFAVISPRSLDGAQGSATDEGALDFANSPVGGGAKQYMTIANSGPGILYLDHAATAAPFTVGDPGHCSMALTIGESCQFQVDFRPTAPGHFEGVVTFFESTPGVTHTVSVIGTGTVPTADGVAPVAGMAVAPAEVTLTPSAGACPLVPAGWAPVGDPNAPLAGQVLTGHAATEDFTGNHQTYDYNWFVYPDPGFRQLLAPGNFRTGDTYEYGRIEVEWEAQTAKAAGGIPRWAWPQRGDRVYLTGHHVVDCGHGGGGLIEGVTGGSFKETGVRAEIHPPTFVATFRNAALTPFDGAAARTGTWHDGLPATEVDVFASNYGGGALKDLGLGLFRSTGLGEVNFKVYAPPKPSRDATLEQEVVNRGNGGTVTLKKMGNGLGYEVTVKQPSGTGTDAPALNQVAAQVFVHWDRAAPSFAAYDVRHYEVTIERVQVLTSLTRDWTFFGYVNDQGAPLVLAGESNLGLPFGTVQADSDAFCSARGRPAPDPRCKAPNGQVRQLSNNVFDTWLVPGQPLHLEVRGRTPSSVLGPLGSGLFAGTADYTLGVTEQATALASSDPGDPVRNIVSGFSLVGGEEAGESCFPGCFVVRYSLRRQN